MNGLILVRKIFTDTSTIGDLTLDGQFLCNTLEDTVRNFKISGKTAIPAGRYEVIINDSARFHRRMPLLLKVPFFDGIRIHNGNTADQTDGCILVGEKDSAMPNFIGHSRDTFEEVFLKIDLALEREPLFIDIIGGTPLKDFKGIGG